MKKHKSSAQFWTMLTIANVIALMYPVRVLFRAESAEENLVAAFLFIGSAFVLMLADTVSIVAHT